MQRITYFERQIIEVGIRCKKSVRSIAKSLKRDHRVIQREVDNSLGESCPYTAIVAQRLFEQRSKQKNIKKLEKEKVLVDNFIRSIGG